MTDLDSLFDEPIISNISDEQVHLQKEYIDKFGHGIPFMYIPRSITKDELYSKIKICIESNNDNLLELLNIDIKPGRKY